MFLARVQGSWCPGFDLAAMSSMPQPSRPQACAETVLSPLWAQRNSQNSEVLIELAGGAHVDFPFCSHLQVAAKWLQVTATSVRRISWFLRTQFWRKPRFLQCCSAKKFRFSPELRAEKSWNIPRLYFCRASDKEILQLHTKNSKCKCWSLLAWVTSDCKWLQNQKSKCKSLARSLQVLISWLVQREINACRCYFGLDNSINKFHTENVTVYISSILQYSVGLRLWIEWTFSELNEAMKVSEALIVRILE